MAPFLWYSAAWVLWVVVVAGGNGQRDDCTGDMQMSDDVTACREPVTLNKCCPSTGSVYHVDDQKCVATSAAVWSPVAHSPTTNQASAFMEMIQSQLRLSL